MRTLSGRKFIASLTIVGAVTALAAVAGPAQAEPAPAAVSATAPAPAQADGTWKLIGKDVFTDSARDSRNQGVTTDGTHWYFSGTNGLEVTDLAYHTLVRALPAIPPALADPSPLAGKGLNHIGDIDYGGGKLSISLDSSKRDPGTGGQYNTPV